MRINNLRYNAQSGAFLASVDIQRDGRMYRYPCELHGPQTMDPATIAAGLAERALRMSDTARN
tara:strand:+ start:6566 stop:6754 length:189 start_codon:yes stop_codon:yes gene_type:complete